MDTSISQDFFQSGEKENQSIKRTLKTEKMFQPAFGSTPKLVKIQCSNFHLLFRGLILSSPPPHSFRQQLTLPASRSNPRPHFSNCMQYDITSVHRCLDNFHKKQLYTTTVVLDKIGESRAIV